MSTQIAPGIRYESTPSHGFIVISEARLADMQQRTPELVTPSSCYPHHRPGYSHLRAFEEDCEWARVCLAFPQFWDADQIAGAHEIMARYNPDIYTAYLNRIAAEEPTP